jgi:hypothetical protein
MPRFGGAPASTAVLEPRRMELNYRRMKMPSSPLLSIVAFAVAITTGCRHRTSSNAAGDPRRGAVASSAVGSSSNQGTARGGGGTAGIPVSSPASATEGAFTVRTPPPLPITQPQENIPARPSPAAIWIAGYYNYTGTSYAWKPGRWEIPPAGMVAWVPPSWQPSGNDYVYVPGHWQ